MSFNFMAAVTIYSDFLEPPKIKSDTVSTVSPSTSQCIFFFLKMTFLQSLHSFQLAILDFPYKFSFFIITVNLLLNFDILFLIYMIFMTHRNFYFRWGLNSITLYFFISFCFIIFSFISNDSSDVKDLLAIMETQETQEIQIGLERSLGE